MFLTRIASSIAVIAISLTLVSAALAAPGDLDPSFGSGGLVTTGFADAASANALALQTDGRIIAAGVTGGVGPFTSNNLDFALARYNPDGSLDTNFGTGGKVTTEFPGVLGASAEAFAAILQPDGRIVAAGFARPGFNTDFGLARYNPNGGLDASFGTNGEVTTDIGEVDVANALALQSDGKIVAAGTASRSDFTLTRYNPDGSLDPSFGTGGKVTTFAGDEAFGVAIQPNGNIVAAGRAGPFGLFNFALVSFNGNGSLDSAFGSGGRVTTDFPGSNEEARAVIIQQDGKIVAGGFAVPLTSDFALARYAGEQIDITPPVISVPGPITMNATSPSGAVVTYSVSATDPDDAVASLTCVPTSGSTFPIGTTTVNCTATDTHGNTSNASFTVHVEGAGEQLADLLTAVTGVGPGTSLADKVTQAQADLAANDVPNACSTLTAFIHEVQAQRGKTIPTGQAATLIADAQRIMTVLGC